MISIRARVRAGERLFGSFVFLPSPGAVEILGRAGLDFVIIDQEHSPKSWETVENMVRAADVCGMAALVRIGQNSDQEILHALEVGASGIVVPFVESADAVCRAASAMRYAPEGRRGTCTQTRAAGFGAYRRDFIELARRTNRELLLVGLVESVRGIDSIDEMIAVDDGLDVVIVGRSDLASDLGVPGQTDHPQVADATDRLLSRLKDSRGAQAGMAIYSAAEAARWTAKGCTFFAFSSESGMLFEAAFSLRNDIVARWSEIPAR